MDSLFDDSDDQGEPYNIDPRWFDESLSPITNPPAIPMQIELLQLGSAVLLKCRGRTALIRHDTSQVCPDLLDESDLWTASAWEPGIDADLIPLCSASYSGAMSSALMTLRVELDPEDWKD